MRTRWAKILKFKMLLLKAAVVAILVIAVCAIVYFKVSTDVIFTLLAAVVLPVVIFWHQKLRGPKFKIHPSPINPIELYWYQDEAFGDLDIIVSNEGAKVGIISEIEVLEGNRVSENIKCSPRHAITTPPPFGLPTAIIRGKPLKMPLSLAVTDRAQRRETYRIRIRVKGSDTCETEEFDVRMPEGAPDAEYGT